MCFELYAKLHLDYLPPGRISDNVVIGLFYKPLGPIPRADNPQGSTVRGIGTTSDFPGGNHIEVSAARTGNHTGFPRGGQVPRSECPRGGQVVTGFRRADRYSPLTRKPGHAVEAKRNGSERALIKKPTAASTVRGTAPTRSFTDAYPSRCPRGGQPR